MIRGKFTVVVVCSSWLASMHIDDLLRPEEADNLPGKCKLFTVFHKHPQSFVSLKNKFRIARLCSSQ